MKRLIFFTVLISCLALSAGCKKSAPPVPALLVFSTANCDACKEFKPIAEEIREEYKGRAAVKIYEIDKTPGSDFAASFNVRATPTIIFLDKEGNQYFRLDRAASKDLIKALLDAKID